MNWYVYGNSDPVNHWDPSGEDFWGTVSGVVNTVASFIGGFGSGGLNTTSNGSHVSSSSSSNNTSSNSNLIAMGATILTTVAANFVMNPIVAAGMRLAAGVASGGSLYSAAVSLGLISSPMDLTNVIAYSGPGGVYWPETYQDWLNYCQYYLNRPLDIPFPNRTPDYYVFSGSMVGISGTAIIDVRGNMYQATGVSAGVSSTLASGAVLGGWLLGYTQRPSEEKLNAFLTGTSVDVSGGYIAGGSVTYSNNQVSINLGAMTPQAGITVSDSKWVGKVDKVVITDTWNNARNITWGNPYWLWGGE